MALDSSLIAVARERLYGGAISDVLDEMNDWDHAMAPSIRPLDDSLVLFGRARTGLYSAVYSVQKDENPYELEIALIDDLKPDDVPVLGCPPGNRVAPWGELLSTVSQVRGAVGCVTDGLVRDIRHIRKRRFPVFAGGIGPLDSKGRGIMTKIDVPIECGGVRVKPGDWIFGDVDGVVVVRDELAEEAITRALEKIDRESIVREELTRGDLLADVFVRHGIL
jgi:4-hydroxy-4-methyl-2-oxoglutarate aldolase